MKTVVAGLFDELRNAQASVEELTENGFSRDDISILANEVLDDDTNPPPDGIYPESSDVESVSDVTLIDAGKGAAVGGTAGFLLGLASLMIPGIGPIMAAGPIVAALSGACLGAAVGGIVGALAEMGISHEHATYYAEGMRRGGTVVTVKTDEALADTAVNIMRRHYAVDMNDRVGRWRRSGWNGYNTETETEMAEEADRELAYEEQRRAA
jgi:hypothetical protein